MVDSTLPPDVLLAQANFRKAKEKLAKVTAKLDADWDHLDKALESGGDSSKLDLSESKKARDDYRNAEAQYIEALEQLVGSDWPHDVPGIDEHISLVEQRYRKTQERLYALLQARAVRKFEHASSRSSHGESEKVRVIATARTLDSINAAARSGLRPLIKTITRSEEIWSRIILFQDPVTGEIEESGDVRHVPKGKRRILEVQYYPFTSPEPYAAYLLPAGLRVGERVWIADLIDDFVGARWNQGPQTRLQSCYAVWNGTDFDIQYDASRHRKEFIG